MERFKIVGIILVGCLTYVYSKYIDECVKKPVLLDEVLNGAYTSESFNGTWISETEIFYKIDELLLKFDVTTKGSQIIAKSGDFDEPNSLKYILSPDKNYVLIRNLTKSVYRHSALSRYSILNLKTKTVQPLNNGELLRTAIWAPVGSALAYVYNNDIYYYKLQENESRALTNDGKSQDIYNGIPDWVYEEEVFGTDKTLWFSPNGEYLAFATFNDTNVPEAVILRYGTPGDLKNQYTSEEKFRYPKAGARNPTVTLNLIDLTDHGSKFSILPTPTSMVGPEPILHAVTWFDNKTVVAKWTNRVQNQSQIITYKTDGYWDPLYDEEVSDGWLLYTGEVPVYHDGYVYMLHPEPVENKTLGSFGHLIRYRYQNGVLDQKEDLTPGNMWVQQIYGINELKRVIYFTASPPNEPSQLQLYEVSLHTPKDANPSPLCVSCTIKTPEGNDCSYVGSVSFSTDYSRYALTCSGPDPAFTKVFDFERNELYSWSTNQMLRDMISKRLLPKQKDLYVESGGFNSKVRLLLPNDFDPNEKYPMLVNVYAGPDSQRISDVFMVGFQSYMATNRRVIYAFIDGRGSANKGTAMLYQVYRNLGGPEIQDQLTVTKKLQQMFPWIDRERTAVWGWSYGGYATTSILTKDRDNVFKCGIAVAPVTNWIYYDSIYTERFMGLPTPNDNLGRYMSSTVLNRVEKLKNKEFMLIHGTGDDNVHYQQSMALAKALAEADVLYELMSYPDESHSLGHVIKHLYHSMDRFWSQCLGYGNKTHKCNA